LHLRLNRCSVTVVYMRWEALSYKFYIEMADLPDYLHAVVEVSDNTETLCGMGLHKAFNIVNLMDFHLTTPRDFS